MDRLTIREMEGETEGWSELQSPTWRDRENERRREMERVTIREMEEVTQGWRD